MFRALIQKEIAKAVPDGVVFDVSPTAQVEHGGYSSNIAMVMARQVGKNPREVAEEIKKNIAPGLCSGRSPIIKRIEIAGPGFLNFYISRDALYSSLQKFGKNKKSSFNIKKLKINIEFVSANPTGPLTMANGRGGFYGDVLANILKRVGHKVTREYYINDTGNQVRLLGDSILAAMGKIPDREDLYKGEYIKDLNGKTAKQAVAYLFSQIKKSLKGAGIKYDVWFSENNNLHKKGELKKTLALLLSQKTLKDHEGALWLGNPNEGGAVLIKSDGTPTYFIADLAYHYDKFIKRKFDIAIDIWGADHHGYVSRMKAGVEALGIEPARLRIILMQLVRLMSGGKEMRMSKRAGNFVTMDELLEMVDVDAARWFFLERSSDTHMDFDLDLARERSKKNPVYYAQYAHARACSILNKAKSKNKKTDLSLLVDEHELELAKKIFQLSEVIEDIAEDYQVQRLPKYAHDLAKLFSEFYQNCKVIDSDNKNLTQARLVLVAATRETLADTLSLMGISAPKKM